MCFHIRIGRLTAWKTRSLPRTLAHSTQVARARFLVARHAKLIKATGCSNFHSSSLAMDFDTRIPTMEPFVFLHPPPRTELIEKQKSDLKLLHLVMCSALRSLPTHYIAAGRILIMLPNAVRRETTTLLFVHDGLVSSFAASAVRDEDAFCRQPLRSWYSLQPEIWTLLLDCQCLKWAEVNSVDAEDDSHATWLFLTVRILPGSRVRASWCSVFGRVQSLAPDKAVHCERRLATKSLNG